MRPSWTPLLSSTGRNVSTREKPVRQSQTLSFHIASRVAGSQATTWSDPTASTSPRASAFQSSSWTSR